MVTMVKLKDWDLRLNAYLMEEGRDVFDWGSNDCALFACGAVMAQTGKHPAPEFIGAYDSREGAAEALRRLGAGTLGATATKILGEPISTSHARRGDIVMAHHALGVCMGKDSWFLSEGGEPFVKVPRADLVKAWRV